MPQKKTKRSSSKKAVPRFSLVPAAVCHNQDTEFLKLIAMVLMVIDHIGAILLPQVRVLRIIGRSAFPLYAYAMSVGAVYTHDFGKYLSRVTAFTLVSQPFYMLAFGRISLAKYDFTKDILSTCWNFYRDSWADPSIMFTLLLGLVLILTLRERKYILTLAGVLGCVMISDLIDYKVYGVLLIVLFYLTADLRNAALPLMAVYILFWASRSTGYTLFGVSFGLQLFAIFALPLIYIPMKTNIRIPKAVHYLFYPVHLFIFYLIRTLGT